MINLFFEEIGGALPPSTPWVFLGYIGSGRSLASEPTQNRPVLFPGQEWV